MRAVAGAVAMRAAAVLLGVGCLVWAALPSLHRAYAGLALALAIAGVAAGGLRLALTAVPVPDDSYWPSPGCVSGARSSTWCGRCPGRRAR